MRGRAAAELLALPVRLHGIELGRPVEVLVDLNADRVVGFEILCGDEARRFLPFAVVELRAGELAIDSALTLIDERDLGFYRRRSRRLRDLGLTEPCIDVSGQIYEALRAA
ncbi:MAG TPA: hypothetical protein VHV52_11340 [Gaiellaceae bacterium]|jgi:hypothetical protein|nr:hypothetical protein [Gaiellaceae bacterium]